jgi:gamma-glutamyltranspeptidase/glutathione hydrolase
VSLLCGGRLVGLRGVPSPAAASRSRVLAPRAMAATSQPLATQCAVEVMRAGGSAVDAAIAANAALGVMEPTGCGIGGDLFALGWDAAARRLWGLNGSGAAARALTLESLHGRLREAGMTRIPAVGAHCVTVPGTVDAWCELHARFGRLPLADVLAPAIRYGREGFPVSDVIAEYWRRNAAALVSQPGFRDVFMPGGEAPAAAATFRNPSLADLYQRIGQAGRAAFYSGEVAVAIERAVGAAGGALCAADLAAHRSDWVEPVGTRYRGVHVWQLPPNGQGLAVLQMLNVLERFDVASMGFGSPGYVHALVEAKKLAFEDRACFYADPRFVEVPLRRLLSKDYAAGRRALIRDDRALRPASSGDPAPYGGDTVCLSVGDAAGNLVSLIQSNYRGMGSGIVPAGLGFVLQNRGESFGLDPSLANVYAPGKRPFHTIIPGFVTRDGEPWLAFGVMGGAMQPQGQVQVLVNQVDFGLDVQQAGDAPRVRHEGSSEPDGRAAEGSGVVLLEPGFDAALADGLRARGHRVVTADDGDYGGYQAVQRLDGSYAGASESRKDGQAAGY